MCTPQKLQVPVQELEITLQQLNRQKARQLTGHCCNWLTCTRSRGSLWDTMHTVTRNWVRHVQLKAVLSTFLKNWHQTGKQNARDISLSLPESWFNVGPIWNAVCTSFLDNLQIQKIRWTKYLIDNCQQRESNFRKWFLNSFTRCFKLISMLNFSQTTINNINYFMCSEEKAEK